MKETEIHCEACDTCVRIGNCEGVKCAKFRHWFSREWRRVTNELKSYSNKNERG